MAYSLIANTLKYGTIGTDVVTTDAINTSGADILVVSLGCYQGDSTTGLSDSKSNTWTLVLRRTATNRQSAMWYAKAPTVGTNHTFTFTNVGGVESTVMAAAFSGADQTSPKDQENGGSGLSGTSQQTGSVTPTQDNELLYTSLYGLDQSPAIDSGFSILDSALSSQGSMSHAYKIQTSAGAENPTWSWANSDPHAVTIVTYKALAAAAQNNRLPLLGVS